jgi:hypothetical protein
VPDPPVPYQTLVNQLAACQALLADLEEEPSTPKTEALKRRLREAQLRMYTALGAIDSPDRRS